MFLRAQTWWTLGIHGDGVFRLELYGRGVYLKSHFFGWFGWRGFSNLEVVQVRGCKIEKNGRGGHFQRGDPLSEGVVRNFKLVAKTGDSTFLKMGECSR